MTDITERMRRAWIKGRGWDGDLPAIEIPRYRLLGLLGEGCQGQVFLAEQDAPRRRVAVKVLSPRAGSLGTLERFRFEVDVLAALDHPGIARVFDAGEAR